MKAKLLVLGCLLFVPAASAETKVARAIATGDSAASAPAETVSVDDIVKKHIAALGGEKLLRGGKMFTFKVSGEKQGKKFTKTVVQARPNKMRVDIESDEGKISKGYDGKVAWMKKGTAPAEKLDAEHTAMMALHATFEEPLLDYAKKGTKVRLVGTSEVKSAPAYVLELTLQNGDVERHFLDVKSHLLVKKTWKGKDKDGKEVQMAVGFGDYKSVQGRMVNHSVEWEYDGKIHKSTVSKVAWDKPVKAKIFAMPR